MSEEKSPQTPHGTGNQNGSAKDLALSFALREFDMDDLALNANEEAMNDIESKISHDLSFQTDVREWTQIMADIGLSAPPQTPPNSLKAKLFARIHSSDFALDHSSATSKDPELQVWKSWASATSSLTDSKGSAKSSIVRRGDSEFERTAIPGIMVRRLSVDPQRDSVTMLVRMEAGTSYPQHRHRGTEECFVLEGDLQVGDESMESGDYQSLETDSLHGKQWTRGGCLLLIRSSLNDEIVR